MTPAEIAALPWVQKKAQWMATELARLRSQPAQLLLDFPAVTHEKTSLAGNYFGADIHGRRQRVC